MKVSFGGIQVGAAAEAAPAATPTAETPFGILLMGDFSGRGVAPLAGPSAHQDMPSGSSRPASSGTQPRTPIMIDRDNFDQVMGKLGVALRLPGAGQETFLRFQELDDFHPDRLFERLDVFGALRDLRRRLDDPQTFPAAAAEVRAWAKRDVPPPPEPVRPEASPQLDPESLLAQVLGSTELPSKTGGISELDALLRQAVRPYLVPGTDPQQPELVALVDEATSNLMRAVLHDRGFQALEAAWRAVFFLVRRLDTDEHLKLYLLDSTHAELAADLNATDDLRATGIYKLLVERTVGTPGGKPWAVLVGNYTFDQTDADAELLGRLAKIAALAGAPFLGAAHPHLVGCESLAATPDADDWQRPSDPGGAEAWTALRQLPETAYVGLALPRFLLRQPYGKDGGIIERFAFEELPTANRHEAYLWGNPAFACAYLLGAAFIRRGWDMQPGTVDTIDGLPVHVSNDGDEGEVKPCAEVVLSDRATAAILSQGLIPLLSVRDSDRVRVPSMPCLAERGRAVRGRWT